MRLTGQAAIVTGAGGGLGEGIAKRLAGAGARVLCADLDGGRALAAAAAIEGAEACAVDVGDAASVAAMVEAATRAFGRLDILVNSAGIGSAAAFLDLAPAEFERVLRVNLLGTFLVGQAAARVMVAAGYGRIVNIASISGERAGWLRTAYGTSKAGVIHLTRQMAMELGERGVTVNAIAPGPVDTAMSRAMHTPQTRAAYARAIPLGRYGTVEEIAAAALFLASPEASYVNGHLLAADGGYLAAGIRFDDAQDPGARG